MQLHSGGWAMPVMRAFSHRSDRHSSVPPLQMVELLKKNPAVAIPVVLARLVQNDSEW